MADLFIALNRTKSVELGTGIGENKILTRIADKAYGRFYRNSMYIGATFQMKNSRREVSSTHSNRKAISVSRIHFSNVRVSNSPRPSILPPRYKKTTSGLFGRRAVRTRIKRLAPTRSRRDMCPFRFKCRHRLKRNHPGEQSQGPRPDGP